MPLLLPPKHYRGEAYLLSRAAASKSRRASDLPKRNAAVSPVLRWKKDGFGIIFTNIGGLSLRLISAASLASENYETLKYKAVCGCSILGHT